MASIRQIGLTGSIASGKSTVAALLEAKNIPVINLDALGRELLTSDAQVAQEVKRLFGAPAFHKNGTIDRNYLRTRVYAFPEERKKLEQVLHPRIWDLYRKKLAELEKAQATKVICEAALLVENQTHKRLDGLIVVTAPDSLRLERLMARDGISEPLARQMLTAQLPQNEKIKAATYHIENTGSITELEKQVNVLLSKLAQ